jgi:hypothetical protein
MALVIQPTPASPSSSLSKFTSSQKLMMLTGELRQFFNHY